MSLLKQLLLSVSCAILAILIGTLWCSVDSARQYLSSQLQAQGESAATSLALTLSQPSNQDPVTQELLIAALYDTGQFERIRLLTPPIRSWWSVVLSKKHRSADLRPRGSPTLCRLMYPWPRPMSVMAGIRLVRSK